MVGQKIDAPDCGLLTGLLLEIGEFRFIVHDKAGRGIRIIVIIVGAAHFLLTGQNVVAVHTAQICVKPLGGVIGVGIGKGIRRRKPGDAFVRRCQSKAVQVGIPPVAPEFNGIAALPQVHQRRDFAPFQIVWKGDLPLVGAVDIQILYLFIGIIGLQVADVHMIKTRLFHFHRAGNGASLVRQVNKSVSRGICAVIGVTSFIGFRPACIIQLGPVNHTLFKFIGCQCL